MVPISPARVLHEWDAISADLGKAFKRDPERNWLDILGQAIAGELRFWRVEYGYVVTQVTSRTLWVIYAGGRGGSIPDWRKIMGLIELLAVRLRCREVRFEGRDWRKVFPDYHAEKREGRWYFRKEL